MFSPPGFDTEEAASSGSRLMMIFRAGGARPESATVAAAGIGDSNGDGSGGACCRRDLGRERRYRCGTGAGGSDGTATGAAPVLAAETGNGAVWRGGGAGQGQRRTRNRRRHRPWGGNGSGLAQWRRGAWVGCSSRRGSGAGAVGFGAAPWPVAATGGGAVWRRERPRSVGQRGPAPRIAGDIGTRRAIRHRRAVTTDHVGATSKARIGGPFARRCLRP